MTIRHCRGEKKGVYGQTMGSSKDVRPFPLCLAVNQTQTNRTGTNPVVKSSTKSKIVFFPSLLRGGNFALPNFASDRIFTLKASWGESRIALYEVVNSPFLCDKVLFLSYAKIKSLSTAVWKKAVFFVGEGSPVYGFFVLQVGERTFIAAAVHSAPCVPYLRGGLTKHLFFFEPRASNYEHLRL